MRICARCEKAELPPRRQLCDTCRKLAIAESKKKYAEKNREPATGLYVSSVGAVVPMDFTLQYIAATCKGAIKEDCAECSDLVICSRRILNYEKWGDKKRRAAC